MLFVRVAVDKDELRQLDELMQELKTRYGEQAHLLFVLNHQETAQGAATVEGYDNLLVYFLHRDAHRLHQYAAYAEPVRCTLDWMIGRPTSAMRIPDLDSVATFCDEICNGYDGLGGLPAFDEWPASTGHGRVLPDLQIVSLGHHCGLS